MFMNILQYKFMYLHNVLYFPMLFQLCYGIIVCIHRKRCITSENQFDFLKDLVANVPDLPSNEEERDGEPKPKR